MANTQILSTAIIFLIAGILGIATSAIATECYDKNPAYKDSKKDNYNYVIVNLVCNIFLLLLSLYSLYIGFTTV
jgi:hypothetical protein